MMSRDKQFHSHSANFDIGQETSDMTRQMSVALMEYGRNLWALQLDTASGMAAETTRQLKHWLQNAADNGAPLNQWPGLYYSSTGRFVEIARGWLNVAARASAEMNALFGQAQAASFALAEESLARYPKAERRTTAMVISFADRRRSAAPFSAPPVASKNITRTA